MPRCEITVELDAERTASDGHPSFRPGEPVAGTVIVHCDEPVKCQGLDLQVRLWRTDHLGQSGANSDNVHIRYEPQRLFEGEWPSGERRYPFRFAAPERPGCDCPQSSWSWEAIARADIPWARDASGKAPFRVERPIARHEDMRFVVGEPVKTGGEGRLAVIKKYAFVFITGPVLAIVATLLVHKAFGSEPHPIAFVVAAVVAEGLVIWSLLRSIERDQLTGPDLLVSIEPPPAGQTAPVLRCHVDARAGNKIDLVWVEARVIEQTCRVEQGGSSSPTSYWPERNTLWSAERAITGEFATHYECAITLPEPGTMPLSTTRDARGRGVYWEVFARIERQGTKVPERTRCEIDVLPAPMSVS